MLTGLRLWEQKIEKHEIQKIGCENYDNDIDRMMIMIMMKMISRRTMTKMMRMMTMTMMKI